MNSSSPTHQEPQSPRQAAMGKVANALGMSPDDLTHLLRNGDPKRLMDAVGSPDPQRLMDLVEGVLGDLSKASEALQKASGPEVPSPIAHGEGAKVPDGLQEAADGVLKLQGDVAMVAGELGALVKEITEAIGEFGPNTENRLDRLGDKVDHLEGQVAARLAKHHHLISLLHNLLGRVPPEMIKAAEEVREVAERLAFQVGQGWASLIAAERLGDLTVARRIGEGIVGVALQADAPDLAVRVLERVQSLTTSGTEIAIEVAVDLGLAQVAADQLAEGDDTLADAAGQADRNGQQLLWVRALRGRAQAAELRGRPQEALAHYQCLVKALPCEGPLAKTAAQAHLAIARLASDGSGDALRSAARCAAAGGSGPLFASAMVELARQAAAAGDRHETLRTLLAARATLDGIDEEACALVSKEAEAMAESWGKESFQAILSNLQNC